MQTARTQEKHPLLKELLYKMFETLEGMGMSPGALVATLQVYLEDRHDIDPAAVASLEEAYAYLSRDEEFTY